MNSSSSEWVSTVKILLTTSLIRDFTSSALMRYTLGSAPSCQPAEVGVGKPARNQLGKVRGHCLVPVATSDGTEGRRQSFGRIHNLPVRGRRLLGNIRGSFKWRVRSGTIFGS